MPEQLSCRWKTTMSALALMAVIVPAAYAGVPDVTQSFYVPQRGTIGTPIEGTAATSLFRMCPNNDIFSVPGNARIRVIVRDVNGVGIPGIAAADICILFNGGTTLQNFFGVGADSIIANNGTPTNGQVCPNVRCIQADAPTGADGSTYVTFKGTDGINPGISVRDPNRKWGHWDSDIPVYVLGFKLKGRLSSAQATPAPEYFLRIKNVDVALGVNNLPDQAERVTGADYTTVLGGLSNVNNPFRYWYDVDNSGSLTGADVTTVLGHLNHNCNNLVNP